MLIQQSFTFGYTDSMPANLLEEMLLLVKKNVLKTDGLREILFKSKFILTELLTNAIKHANVNEVNINLEITDKALKFIKTDFGTPLKFPQVKDEQFKDALIITADIMHTLYAIQKEDAAYFYCHENTVPSIDTENDFPEHFGLLIITKAADEFSYYYNPQDNSNTFTATINL